MKIKLIPKNEQELSKVFLFFAPLVILLAVTINLIRDFYFLFSDALPHTRIFNYGVLDKISNQASYNLLLVFLFVFATVYLLSKSIGRSLILFPLFFLSCLGIVGIESLDIVLGLIFCVLVYYLKDLSIALGKTDRIPLTLAIWTPIIALSLFTFIGVLQINEK